MISFFSRSTTLRYLINRILSKTPYVAVIDCDVGQPEFTPSGQLSLHIFSSQKTQESQSNNSSPSPSSSSIIPLLSPPHLHLHQPELSFYLGDITIKNIPEMFENCISLLFEKFLLYCEFYQVAGRIPPDPEDVTREHLQEYARSSHFHLLSHEFDDEDSDGEERCSFPLPLLINTDGMLRGMGVEIQRFLLNKIQPSHILHLQNEKERMSIPIEEFVSKQQNHQKKVSLCILTPGRMKASRLAAQDLRDIRSVVSSTSSSSPHTTLTL
jgi:hypothetical protein